MHIIQNQIIFVSISGTSQIPIFHSWVREHSQMCLLERIN